MSSKPGALGAAILIFAAVGSAACSRFEQSEAAQTQASVPTNLFIGLDTTLSYGYRQQCLDLAGDAIRRAPPGSLVTVRYISDDSYLPRNAFLTERIPSVQEESNPFANPASKARSKGLAVHSERTRVELAQRVIGHTLPGAPRTDIYGFLVVVSERRSASTVCLLLTDLKNNVPKYERFLTNESLTGITIAVLCFDNSDPARREQWRKRFGEWGASQVIFGDPDQGFPSELLNCPERR